MTELWRRDDGWQIEVYSHDPLFASRIPMTNDTVDRSTPMTYARLVAAFQASGYGLVNAE